MESFFANVILFILTCIFILLLFKLFISSIELSNYNNVEIIIESYIGLSSTFILKWRQKICGIWTFEKNINQFESYSYKIYSSFNEAQSDACFLLKDDNLKKRIESIKPYKRVILTKTDTIIKDIIE